MAPDLRCLAPVAAEVAHEWRIELGRPSALARYSYVAPADNGAVLKVTPHEDPDADEGADALELWDGDGTVRLLRRDARRRAMLIERRRPGTDLSAVPEEQALAIAVDVGRRLWRPASDPFPSPSTTWPRSSGIRFRTGCGWTSRSGGSRRLPAPASTRRGCARGR
jgi:streptomycin 6-kinase